MRFSDFYISPVRTQIWGGMNLNPTGTTLRNLFFIFYILIKIRNYLLLAKNMRICFFYLLIIIRSYSSDFVNLILRKKYT